MWHNFLLPDDDFPIISRASFQNVIFLVVLLMEHEAKINCGGRMAIEFFIVNAIVWPLMWNYVDGWIFSIRCDKLIVYIHHSQVYKHSS